MSMNFWKEAKSPLFMLAPMEDVTETSFREVVMRNSSPDNLNIVFTEFTSTDGLCHPKGRDKVSERLVVSSSEAAVLKRKGIKIVAQIWGNSPEKFYNATKHIDEQYHFDGIDINMGCPVKNVVRKGCCSALIGNPTLAGEIIQATKEATNLPVSVKTRTGVKTVVTEEWIGFMLEQQPDAIILHGRTQKQMSDGTASWDEIKKAAQLRSQMASSVKIIGNGDITSMHEAKEKVLNYGIDGAMIGRGIFANPWLFSNGEKPTVTERLKTLEDHLLLFRHNWEGKKNYQILKRFFKIYLSEFRGAAELRARSMETNGYDQMLELIKTAKAGFDQYETVQTPPSHLHPPHPQMEVEASEVPLYGKQLQP
ncbi:dihydrouridine synthase [Alkalitalea saponilacus]|uniref:tRNA-dihydrouridine synthase n=1 Tax=Alkalitalea saponilacus TaxID=889453 RepID=A0A1T5DE89_9BACT|nr:dihydrouridine synthase [Alkalitalea saponilacus]SKB69921.1 tRNA-dihydrouridine synthase [Alkalitalea saponilacus]